jgi:hypothetical protein
MDLTAHSTLVLTSSVDSYLSELHRRKRAIFWKDMGTRNRSRWLMVKVSPDTILFCHTANPGDGTAGGPVRYPSQL